MQRHVLGILAILSLAAGGFLLLKPDLFDTQVTLSAMGIRIGMVLAVLWLAFPHLEALPNSLMMLIIIAGVGLAIIARWKQLIPIAAVMLIVVLVLRPKTKKSR